MIEADKSRTLLVHNNELDADTNAFPVLHEDDSIVAWDDNNFMTLPSQVRETIGKLMSHKKADNIAVQTSNDTFVTFYDLQRVN